jgi:hypothetical protein
VSEQLAKLLSTPQPAARSNPTPELPKGWEPGFEWDGEHGELTTGPVAKQPDGPIWDHLLADWGLDPDLVEIVGNIRVKGWDSPVKGTETGETIRLRSYSVNIRRRTAGEDRADVTELCKRASRRRTVPRVDRVNAERAMVVALSDWQMGKGEGGGSAATVDRITGSIAHTLDWLKQLRRLKHDPDVIYLVGIGDLVEQCSGHYGSQAFTVDLNRREQMRVVRRLLLGFVDELVDRSYRVVVSGVPGNHGENRNGNGDVFTTVDDNDDLAVIEQVAEVFASNPDRYGNVSVVLPTNLAFTLDVAGVLVGFFHGHGKLSGATPAAKIENWWKGQIVGNLETVKDAQILVTGHFHHLVVSEALGRTHIQCPAMDGGSQWFTTTTGQSSPTGMVSFMVGREYGPRGYDLLRVLGPLEQTVERLNAA